MPIRVSVYVHVTLGWLTGWQAGYNTCLAVSLYAFVFGSVCISPCISGCLPHSLIIFVWFDIAHCIHASVYFAVPVFLHSCLILSVWLSDLFMAVGFVRLSCLFVCVKVKSLSDGLAQRTASHHLMVSWATVA